MNEREMLDEVVHGRELSVLTESLPESGRQPSVSPFRPLFLLGPPHSHAGAVCAMLGQHPQMCSLPETHLFNAPTLAAWWNMCDKSNFRMADGLLRAVAYLFFGDQTDDSVKEADGWLRRRSQFSTGLVYEVMAERVSPLLLVESSSTVVFRPAALKRILRLFPSARFIHLVQHPRGFGEFLMRGIQEASTRGAVPYWMLNLASFPAPSATDDGTPHKDSGLDPQRAWYVLNANVHEFLKGLPERQKLLLHLEDLVREPGVTLCRIVGWLGLQADEEAIERMQHPEHSPFARLGPPAARYGNESAFLQSPTVSESLGGSHSLEGALSWKQDGRGFLPKVRELAKQFGYV